MNWSGLMIRPTPLSLSLHRPSCVPLNGKKNVSNLRYPDMAPKNIFSSFDSGSGITITGISGSGLSTGGYSGSGKTLLDSEILRSSAKPTAVEETA